MDNILIELALILFLGITAQLIAWFTRVPSILLLIGAGFVAGPVLGLLDPDTLFGELLEPLVALSVAIILFEGGLNLKIREVRSTAPSVLRLISLGVLITWAAGSIAAVYVLGMEWPLALLLGAILVVSGPTVIIPLLQYLRPGNTVSTLLKWEGIIIDPIGAILALIVLEIILVGGSTGDAALQALAIILKSLAAGAALGLGGAVIIVQALKRHVLPDYLHIPATLGMLVAVFLLSELIQPNAGLFTAIIMGAVLANQNQASIANILEFKENLRVILISLMFIILSGRLELSLFEPLSYSLVIFVLILVLVARPLSVLASTVKSGLKTGEKLLLSSVAPRGIVSASIASVFAFRLAGEGFPEGELLLPVTFAVIFGTILCSSTIPPLIMRVLKTRQVNPQGVIFVGGQAWVRSTAALLAENGIKCLIIDANKANVAYARRKGLDAIYADALAGSFLDDTDFSEYGYIIAVTSDDNYNTLVDLRLSKEFGSSNVFMLPLEESKPSEKHYLEHLPGRTLFDNSATYDRIAELFERGRIKLRKLDEAADKAGIVTLLGKEAIPLFALGKNNSLTVITAESRQEFKADTRLVALEPAGSQL